MNILFLLLTILGSPPVIDLPIVSVEEGVYKKTISRWQKNLDIYVDEPSITLIKKMGIRDRKHLNGSRDYIIWMPSGVVEPCELSCPAKTIGIVWFHGHTGFSDRTFRERILKQFAQHYETNFFIVIPEMPWSWNTSTRTKRNGLIWTKPGEFISFIEKVKADVSALGVRDNIDWRVVGHSAGGSTIATVGSTGDLCQLKPSRIIWSDSTYGWWLEKANKGCLQDFKTDVYVTHWKSKTNIAASRFVKTHRGRNTTMHTTKFPHLKIGDNIVKLSGVLNDN